MGFIYVVKLHENKRYIYFTTNSDLQFWEFDKDISEFLYYYGALEVDRIIPNCDKYDTDKYVKKYMKHYGLDNIRGGSYNNLKLTSFEKEFIQKELDYIDIDDNKYNDKNKKKIEWIEYYEDKLRQIKNNGYWVLIKPEENPNSRLPKFLLNKVYSKYGSKDWKCNDIEKKENHLIINKKYTNKVCTKKIKNKTITFHTEFYFLNNKKKKQKESLVSRTKLVISYLNL